MKGFIKCLTLIVFLSFLSFTAFSQTKFDEGFSAGYKKGYCQDVQNCILPIPPIAPIPNVSEKSTSYQDGYNRGFQMGLDAQKQNASGNSQKGYKTASSDPTIDYMYKPSKVQLAVAKNKYEIFDRIMEKAQEFYDNTNYTRCIKACNDAMEITKLKSKGCYLLIEKSYDKLGKKKQAEKYAKKALKL